jgi:hypothetical protein
VGAESEYEAHRQPRLQGGRADPIVGFFGPGVEPTSVQGWRGEITAGQVEFEPIDRLNGTGAGAENRAEPTRREHTGSGSSSPVSIRHEAGQRGIDDVLREQEAVQQAMTPQPTDPEPLSEGVQR